MRTARLKNTFLGIIAINLTLITLIQLDIFPPKAYASENVPTATPLNTNYGLVPLNENGNVNVEVVGVVDAHCHYYVGSFDDGQRWLPMKNDN